MEQTTEIQINYDSPEAAQPFTKEGWRSSDGFFYGEEHQARWSGCTHVKCNDCGDWTPKNYTICEKCRAKKNRERFLAMPFKDWDGITPLVLHNDDRYFFDESDLIEYCEENEIETLNLCICEANHLYHVDESYWEDVLPEDGEVSNEVKKAIAELNAVIDKQGPISWEQGKFRTSYTLTKD